MMDEQIAQEILMAGDLEVIDIRDEVFDWLDNDEISPTEEGFLVGYFDSEFEAS